MKATFAYQLGFGITDLWSEGSECFTFSNVFILLSVRTALEAPSINMVFDYPRDNLLDTFIFWPDMPLRMNSF